MTHDEHTTQQELHTVEQYIASVTEHLRRSRKDTAMSWSAGYSTTKVPTIVVSCRSDENRSHQIRP